MMSGWVRLRRSGSPRTFRGNRFRDHPPDARGAPDLLHLTQPDIISSVHHAYLDAGADITTTNTFTATSIGQADYGLQGAVYDMNLAGARLAREAGARHEDSFVAGSVGPLNVTLSLSPRVEDASYRTVTFDQVYEAYAEQIRGLRDGGVDLLLIETIFDTLNAKAAIAAAMDVAPELPRWISVTIVDRSGRTLSGQTIEAFWTSVEHAEPFSVGVNCSLGPANILGGCCGTTPEHIRRVATALEGLPPRRVPASRRLTSFSGLEPFSIRPDTGFVMIGERTNITGSRRFHRLIDAGDFQGGVEVALEQ